MMGSRQSSLPPPFAIAVFALCALGALCGAVVAFQRPEAPYPPDWAPADLADARERPVGTETEVYVSVGPVQVSAPSRFRCRVGHREELPLLLTKRGTTTKRIRITGAGPRGVTLDPTDVTMGEKKLVGGVTPAVQTVLLHDAYLMLSVEVDKETGRMPIKLLAEPTRPIFGVHLPQAAQFGSADRPMPSLQAANIPAQFLNLERGSDARAEATLDTLLKAAGARPPLLLPLADWLEPQGSSVQAAIERWRTDALAFSPGSLAGLCGDRADVTQAGQAVLRAAEAIATATRDLNLPAEIISPTFPRTVTESDTFEAKLLLWLLANGMGEQMNSVSFDLGAAPAPADKEPESWRQFDRSADLSALWGLVRRSSAELGIWCGTYGVASGGDQMLDALAAVRREAAFAFHGVRGAAYSPLAYPGLRPPARGESVPLCAASDDGESLIAAALGEALTELAGVRPVQEAEDSPPCSMELGSEITFLPFLRGDEGIVWIWSNAPGPRTLRLILRQEPLGKREITFSAKEPFIQRATDLLFVAERRPKDRAYYVEFTIASCEIKAFAFPIAPPLPAWLDTVTVR